MSNRRKPKFDWKKAAAVWVDWFRGVNDPVVREKVGVLNAALTRVQSNATNWVFVRGGGGQVPRLIVYPKKSAVPVFEEAVPRLFPKIRGEVVDDEIPKPQKG